MSLQELHIKWNRYKFGVSVYKTCFSQLKWHTEVAVQQLCGVDKVRRDADGAQRVCHSLADVSRLACNRRRREIWSASINRTNVSWQESRVFDCFVSCWAILLFLILPQHRHTTSKVPTKRFMKKTRAVLVETSELYSQKSGVCFKPTTVLHSSTPHANLEQFLSDSNQAVPNQVADESQTRSPDTLRRWANGLSSQHVWLASATWLGTAGLKPDKILKDCFGLAAHNRLSLFLLANRRQKKLLRGRNVSPNIPFPSFVWCSETSLFLPQSFSSLSYSLSFSKQKKFKKKKSCKVKICLFNQWRLFIIISRESKWGTLKRAGNPRCAVPAESHSICTDWRRPGPAASLQVSPTSDTCQSVAILMNRRHCLQHNQQPSYRHRRWGGCQTVRWYRRSPQPVEGSVCREGAGHTPSLSAHFQG